MHLHFFQLELLKNISLLNAQLPAQKNEGVVQEVGHLAENLIACSAQLEN